jgi:phytoene dehydrogenase-like protein
VEANPWIGGGTTTKELTRPGFRHNIHANFFFGYEAFPMHRDLELARHGFDYVVPPVQWAWMTDDDRALVLHRDLEASVRSIARFSERDAGAYRDLHRRFAGDARPLMRRILFSPPVPPHELQSLVGASLADDLHSFARHSMYEAIDDLFDSEPLRIALKTQLHIMMVDDAPGTGSMLPAIVANMTRLVLPVGGAGSYATALARVVTEAGGAIYTAAPAAEIVVAGGVARGVVLEDGTRIGARSFVASAIDFPQTIELAGAAAFPPEVIEKARTWKWNTFSLTTLHLALREQPRFTAAADDPDAQRAANFLFGVADSEQLAAVMRESENGVFPTAPVGNGCCPSAFDATYAPPGLHSAFWWPLAPWALDGEPDQWDVRRDELAATLLDHWRCYAPNLHGQVILGESHFTPLDIVRSNRSMVRGGVRGGAHHPDQHGFQRPHPALSGYRSTIENLFLCGTSSAHGGGVNSAPGYNAAAVIADAIGVARWWPEPEFDDAVAA